MHMELLAERIFFFQDTNWFEQKLFKFLKYDSTCSYYGHFLSAPEIQVKL